MKILYFTQLFYPALFGGGEYIFYHWAKELVKKGHDVFVITQNLQDTKSFEVINGIKIFRVGSKVNIAGNLSTGIFSNLSYLLGSYFLGRKILKENKIDVIHSNSYVPVLSAQWCAKQIPHIATIHDVYFTSKKDFWKTWSQQNKTSLLTKFLGPYIENKVVKTNVSLFHTVSKQSKSDIESLGITTPIKIIPNGVDTSLYQVPKKEKKFQAIYVGRLVFYKNIDVVIDAFSTVIKKIPSSQLIIVGDGPMKLKLSEKICKLNLEKNIHLKGNVSDNEKYDLIQESNILLNPSLIEGFGIVVLEGFAAGKPVIVSDSKPLSDLVDDNVDGFILKHDDSDMWAQKIIQLFNNESMAKQMGLSGRLKVHEKYFLPNLVDELVCLYDTIIR